MVRFFNLRAEHFQSLWLKTVDGWCLEETTSSSKNAPAIFEEPTKAIYVHEGHLRSIYYNKSFIEELQPIFGLAADLRLRIDLRE